jgi:putative intracellular protease/amidase
VFIGALSSIAGIVLRFERSGMSRQFFTQTTLLGRVTEFYPNEFCFKIRTHSGDEFYSYTNTETWYRPLPHLHASYDRYGTPEGYDDKSPEAKLKKYLAIGALVLIEGILHRHHMKRRVDVRTIYLLYSQKGELISEKKGRYMFEDPRWWIDLISAKGNRWFQTFFADGTIDFARYRTELNILYQPKSEMQEVATLSRLLYGFAVTYQLTGHVRYLDALRAGVQYQRNTFKVSLPDGRSVFWASFYDGTNLHLPSNNGDDDGTIPLYEQIYSLAGLTMFYRITGDLETLHDILATVDTFNKYFLDKSDHGNYFSHLDPDTLSPVGAELGKNRNRKNWNSVGDHVPAYLINLLCALSGKSEYKDERKCLHSMLLDITRDIVKHFPPTDSSQMVFERFFQDWTPDLTYSWQQDRGIVGHNLKIAWNLNRVAFYLDGSDDQSEKELRESCLELAKKIAIAMDDLGGVDRFRGGCLDALERNPTNGFDLMFTWMSTKDFWQQEQGILAYLIQMGTNPGSHIEYEKFRELAASMSTFYCAFFLDLDRGGVHFRVSDIGAPVLTGMYADKGGHAKSGYHIFELCYLAHIYTLMYNNPSPFTLYYAPTVPENCEVHLSVSPDFLPAHSINFRESCVEVIANGLRQPKTFHPKDFDVKFDLPKFLKGTTVTVKVTLQPATTVPPPCLPQPSPVKGKIAVVVESHFDEFETVTLERRCKEEGYQYEYISTLWGNDFLEFQGNECQDPIRVFKDIDTVNIDDYACFFFVGAYCMDRLYYQADPKKDQPNQSPVVKLIRKLAAENKICATICHSLWAFACSPEVMSGKKVTCAHNIIDHVISAGGIVVYNADGVGTVPIYEDDWLLSCNHGGKVDMYLNTLFAKLGKC